MLQKTCVCLCTLNSKAKISTGIILSSQHRDRLSWPVQFVHNFLCDCKQEVLYTGLISVRTLQFTRFIYIYSFKRFNLLLPGRHYVAEPKLFSGTFFFGYTRGAQFHFTQNCTLQYNSNITLSKLKPETMQQRLKKVL